VHNGRIIFHIAMNYYVMSQCAIKSSKIADVKKCGDSIVQSRYFDRAINFATRLL